MIRSLIHPLLICVTLSGCVISEGQIGQTNAPEPAAAMPPAPDSTPPEPSACERCAAEQPDALQDCLRSGRAVEACVALIQACDTLCDAEFCETCAAHLDQLEIACQAAERPDCQSVLTQFAAVCEACDASPACAGCAVLAMQQVGGCVLSGGGLGCIAQADAQLSSCGCAPTPTCVSCLDALPACGAGCPADVMAALGDCAVTCAGDPCACDLAQDVVGSLCAPAMSPFCGPLAEVVVQACEAACEGDVCQQCTHQVDRAFLTCSVNDEPDCEARWESEMGTCIGACGPPDECGFCHEIVTAELAGCSGPDCAALLSDLQARCDVICGSPACAECGLPAIFATLECLRVETPSDCRQTLDAFEICPAQCGFDCTACGIEADLGYAICRTDQPEVVCRELQAGTWAECDCAPPPCEARIAAAHDTCELQFGAEMCAQLQPFIDQICMP